MGGISLHIDALRSADGAGYGLDGLTVKLLFVERIGYPGSLHGFLSKILHNGTDVEDRRRRGYGHQVGYLQTGLAVEGHRTEDSRQTEHVLTFEEAAVALTVNLTGHHILPADKIRGDVERGGRTGILGKPDVAAVDIEIEERIYTVEVEIDLSSVPRFGNGKCTAVGADLVAVLVGQPILGRLSHDAFLPVVHLHLVLENNALVGIDRHAPLLRTVGLQAGNGPVHGNLHIVPFMTVFAHLVVRGIEAKRTLVGISYPAELPLAVQAFPER